MLDLLFECNGKNKKNPRSWHIFSIFFYSKLIENVPVIIFDKHNLTNVIVFNVLFAFEKKNHIFVLFGVQSVCVTIIHD